MKLLTQICLLCISLWSGCPAGLRAQCFPSDDGQRICYSANLETAQAYVSGICILLHDGDVVRGCLLNEFGVTVVGFTYSLRKRKVRVHEVLPMMDRWYIRRVLKKDLCRLMERLQQGATQYRNERQHITYQLTPMHETEE